MKKRALIFGGLLLLAMSLNLTGCGSDDKENEIVEDPLAKTTEYFIVGVVSNANGDAIKGAQVEVSKDIKAATNDKGAYSLTVTKAGTYTVKFSATGQENFEHKVTIADNAANRSQATLSVKMAKAIDMSKGKTEEVKTNEKVEVEVPSVEETSEAAAPAAKIDIPAGGAEAGTTITAVAYEEPKAATTTTETGTKKVSASVANVAIVTTPADAIAKADIKINVANASTTGDMFDAEHMTALRENTATTKAPTDFGKVTFENNNYVVTIPTGKVISGKYSTKVNYDKNNAAIKAGEYNVVNGKNEVVKFRNEEYSAKSVKLVVESMQGWKYTTDPAAALTAIGASKEQAAFINKAIVAEEGKEGTYSTTLNLTASISGNHELVFGSKAKTQEKTYTFYLVVNKVKKQAVVKLLRYAGYTEEYSNTPIGKHSGGK